MNYYVKYIFVLVILIIFGMLFENYKKEEAKKDKMEEYELIKKYLLNDSSLARTDKPILWIHVEFDTNARWWPSFGSRNTKCFNQPYQYLTIKSIVDHCGHSFNVCLIDDDSFNNILPGWNTKIGNLPDPLREHLRQLAITKTLYNYGGMIVPSSFICLKNLYPLYNKGCSSAEMFCGELIPKSDVSTLVEYFPSHLIMGCVKNSEIMNAYMKNLERVVSQDYTNEMEFTGDTDRWLYQQVLHKKIMPLDAKYFGVKSISNQPVILDDLLDDNDDFSISQCAFGLYIPQKELLRRSSYGWFVRMSAQQVLRSNTIIGRYLLLSN